MSLDADVRPGAVKAAQDQENSFKPVPKGNYDVTIVKSEVAEYKSGKYANRRYLNVRVKVLKTAPVGAGREFFVKVPLFSNWNPSAKYPDGWPTLYAAFFTALGVSDDVVDSGRGLPGPSEIQGKPLSVYIAVREPDDYHNEDWNDISRISKPKTGTPAAVSEVGDDGVWGTASAPTAATTDPWLSSGDEALAAAAASGRGF